MTEVIKTGKAGVDILGTAGTLPGNLTYSSDYNTLKYYTSGTVTLVPAGTNVAGTVAHSLGYIPFFVALVDQVIPSNIPPTVYGMCPTTFSDSGNYSYGQAYADSTNLYCNVYTNSNVGTFHFKYFIFRNNLGL